MVRVGPGWGVPRDTNPDSQTAEAFGAIGLGPLRAAGYNVLTWDPRGFGQSGGTVEADSPDFEARDASALISYVARQPEAQLDRAGDPRVGMAGASYGGGIPLATAATLFTLDEAIRNYGILRKNRVPIKRIWFCGGHGACFTSSGPSGFVENAIVNWFARYLKRNRTVATGQRFQWIADDGQLRTAN